MTPNIIFQFVDDETDITKYQARLYDSRAGAVVTFEGRVRDVNNNQSVVALEYQAQRELCEQEAGRIMQAMATKYALSALLSCHRLGRLNMGDCAVWIAAAAEHRQQAFQAVAETIDAFKKHLPVWKKEFYRDGSSQWLPGHIFEPYDATHRAASKRDDSAEAEYYRRQQGMFSLGPAAQRQLKDAKVLVVGAGGLGSSVLSSLVQIGVGTIGICEFDFLEVTNLHRQELYSFSDIGELKLALAKERLRNLNPNIHLIDHPNRLDENNIVEILAPYSLVLDCTDNVPTKFLLNDACVKCVKPLIQANIFQLQGEIRGYYPDRQSPCLRCLWLTAPKPADIHAAPLPWVVGMTPSIVGHLQALEAVKFLLGLADVVSDGLLLVDLSSYRFERVKVARSLTCPVCSKQTQEMLTPKECGVAHG